MDGVIVLGQSRLRADRTQLRLSLVLAIVYGASLPAVRSAAKGRAGISDDEA